MTLLTALPSDLFFTLLDTLALEETSTSRNALLNLGLTQKRCWDLVKPVLYRRIVLNERFVDLNGFFVEVPGIIPAFASHVFRDSHVAYLVQSIECRNYGGQAVSPIDDQTFEQWRVHQKVAGGWPAADDLDKVLKAQVKKASQGREEEEQWFNAIRWLEIQEALVVLLLTALPNLQKVTLEPFDMGVCVYTHKVIERAMRSYDKKQKGPLHQVREAVFNGKYF